MIRNEKIEDDEIFYSEDENGIKISKPPFYLGLNPNKVELDKDDSKLKKDKDYDHLREI